MTPRPPGSEVRLTVTSWEGELPVEGDFLRTRTGRCYKIEAVRAHMTRGTRRLATFTCRVLEDDAVEFGQPGVYWWEWNPRKKRAVAGS